MPNATMWRDAYGQHKNMCYLREMIISPSNMNKANLAKVNFNYRGTLRNLHLVLENEVIVLCEPVDSDSDSFCKLRVVQPLRASTQTPLEGI